MLTFSHFKSSKIQKETNNKRHDKEFFSQNK